MTIGSIVVIKESVRFLYESTVLDENGEPVRVCRDEDCVLDVIGIDGDRFSILRSDARPSTRTERRDWRLEAISP